MAEVFAAVVDSADAAAAAAALLPGLHLFEQQSFLYRGAAVETESVYQTAVAA